MKSPRTHYCGMITGLPVYVVNGELIRNTIDIDFTCGGNEAVYPNYVPKNEIWIDDALGPLDRTATLLHEIVERNLMINKRWSYDRAHDAASARERPFRRELAKNPPKEMDLARVTAALLSHKTPRQAQLVMKGKKRHDREYPRVAAVGKRRSSAQVKREAMDLINSYGRR